MTRKDYELIAGVLSSFGDAAISTAYTQEQEGRGAGCLVDDAMALFEITCLGFADKLSENNPHFNAVVFLEACGLSNLVGENWRAKYTTGGE